MELLKLGKSATVEEYPDAGAIHVVTRQLANSLRSLSAILATRIAAPPLVNLPQMARYVVLALAFVILKRSAVALQQLALLTLQLQMVCFHLNMPFSYLLTAFRNILWQLTLLCIWTVHIP